MRPRGYYVVFLAFALSVCQGYQQARQLSPERAYVRFGSRLEAEEFAAWWRYDRPHWTERKET